VVAVVFAIGLLAQAQTAPEKPAPKPSTLPNPYRLVPDWPTLPATMKGPNGRNHSPNKSNSARIVKYSPRGTFIKAWGAQVFTQDGGFVAAWRQGQPSSVYVDKQDNIDVGATYQGKYVKVQ
jgi:hypothetical protein